MIVNSLEERVAAGGPALGMFASDPDMVELLAHMGFDWFAIDQMFTANDWSKTEMLIRTGEAAGITPIVRVQSNPWMGYDPRIAVDATRALGVGAEYLLVSQSEQREIEECLTVSRDWHRKVMHIHPFDSLDEWEAGIADIAAQREIIPQPETRQGIDEAKSTIELDGIRYLFFAMTDASRELAGKDTPDWYAPKLWEVLDEAVEHGRRHGVTIGANTSYAYELDELQRRVVRLHEHGVKMILIQSAPFLFQVAIGGFLRDLRSATE